MSDGKRTIVIDDIPTDGMPYEVGSVHMDDNGKVSVKPDGHALRFRFAFDDIRFSALARRREQAGSLRLCGALGVLPYSAESAAARTTALEVMREAGAATRGRFVVSDDQSILFLGDLTIPLPFTAEVMLTHLTVGLIELQPYIGRVREALSARRRPDIDDAEQIPLPLA